MSGRIPLIPFTQCVVGRERKGGDREREKEKHRKGERKSDRELKI